MFSTKYNDLISRNITKKSKHIEVKGPKIEFGGKELSGGTDLDISWYSPTPFSIRGTHTHDFDEFLCFLPGDPNDLNEYQAEIELSFGEEEEKQVLVKPSIVYFPKGLPHGNLNFKKIDKPISYMKICLSPRYSATQRIFETQYRKYITNPTIGNDIIKQCFYVNDNLVGKEEKSVQKLTYMGKETNGSNLTMHWYSVKEPFTLYHSPHSYAYKRYELFMGGNPIDVEDFDSEVGISLGEQAETHIVNATAMVHIQEGLVHRKTNFKRVGKPIIFVNFLLTADDQK